MIEISSDTGNVLGSRSRWLIFARLSFYIGHTSTSSVFLLFIPIRSELVPREIRKLAVYTGLWDFALCNDWPVALRHPGLPAVLKGTGERKKREKKKGTASGLMQTSEVGRLPPKAFAVIGILGDPS